MHAFVHIFSGKGPCDAIGGTFKRNAMRVSLQRINGKQITTPKEFHQFAKSRKEEWRIEFILCKRGF